jgi:hypothetical protein
MSNPRSESPETEQPDRQELKRNLDAMEKALFDQTRKLTSTWRLGAGKFVSYPVVGSGQISFMYFIFSGCCFIAGIVLTLYGTVAQNVGVALIVGSILSLGAFVAQFWTVTAQQERNIAERIQGVDPRIAELQEMYREIIQLSDRIRSMPSDQ